MYGGASAYRKRCRIIFPRDETNNVAVKNSVDMKPTNTDTTSSTSSVNLSKTARRILDALEHFTSPVMDAKKIPAVTRTIGDLSKSPAPRKTPYSRETKAASNKELLVPTVPDLLKMKLKSRLQDSTVQVRKVATTSTSVLNSSEYTIRTEQDAVKPQKQHSNKMKTKIIREIRNTDTDIVVPVKLPDVQLPITNLPKFDFSLPPPVSTPVKSPKPVEKPAEKVSKPAEPVKPTVKPVMPQTSAEYKFASPILVQDAPRSVATVNSYKFSEPLDAKMSQPTSVVVPALTFKASNVSTAPRRKDLPKNNGQTSSTFSLQPPAQFTTGSVMDILGKNDNKTVAKPAATKSAVDTKPSDSLMDKFKPAIGTWECTACMVRNLPTATRCLACETLKEPPKKQAETPASASFGAQFKMAADKWECTACMVRNNQADTACVACTTPKPGAVKASAPSSSVPAASSTFSGFGMQFKPAEGTWECSACMIRNKSDVVKCVACESPKPGIKIDKPTLIMSPTAGPGFGDFIKKQQSNNWECESCMVRNPAEKTQCVCCDTPKPGVQPQVKSSGPQFKFGINQTTTPTTGGFKFGIDKTDAAKPSTTFSFGIPSAAKPVDTTSSSAATTPAPTGFTFGIPATKIDEKKTEAAVSVTTTVTSLPVASKPSSTTTTPSDAPKTFTFGKLATTSQPANTTNVKTTSSFSFGTNSTSQPTTTAALPTFSFTTTTTAPVTATAAVTVTKSNPVSTFSSTSGTSIFGGTISTPATVPATTISFGAGTKSVTATTVITTAVTSSTFSFGATSSKPVTFGSENSLPQFNFGAGSLPFNPSTGTVKSGNATVATTTAAATASGSSFGASTSAFGAVNNASFTFSPAPNTTAPATNKAAVKPFAFGNGDAKPTPTFSFTPKDKPTTAPLAKAPVFNFGAPSNTKPGDGFNSSGTAPNTGLFSFNAAKPDTKPPSYGAATSGGVFGTPAASTPQNGGFNFASAATPSFNFGENTGFSNPGAFGFGGQSQV